jgi:hypothetical protein
MRASTANASAPTPGMRKTTAETTTQLAILTPVAKYALAMSRRIVEAGGVVGESLTRSMYGG